MICLHLNTAIGLYRFVYIYTLQLPCIALFTATHCNCLVSLCLHLHTAIALYRLDQNQRFRNIFACPSNKLAFYGPELDL